MEDKDIKFVVRHYRKGLFAVEPGMRSVMGRRAGWWTRARIAAAAAVLLAVGATAAVLVQKAYFRHDDRPQPEMEAPAVVPEKIVRVIDFEETPLPQVVDRIKEVYGVNIGGVPDNADGYVLSLHYEGNATDLIDTINEILETDMTVITTSANL